jgi:putative nucleotidyltransferase with HDIG domain
MPGLSVRERILRLNELYSLPEVALDCLRLEESAEGKREFIRRLTAEHQTATTVLRLCAPSRELTTPLRNIPDAIDRLDFRSVRAALLAACVREAFVRPEPAQVLDITQFWRHSIETALNAQMLAERCGCQPPQEAFAAGLLHDVGLLLMGHVFGESYRSFLKSELPSEDWAPHENDRFGIDHAEAGSWWCQTQGVPESICDAVRRHHDRGLAVRGVPDDERLAFVTALADRISQMGCEPRVPLTRRRVESKNRILTALGLHPIDLTFAGRSAVEALHEMGGILRVDIGSELDILRNANQCLRESYSELEQLLLETPVASREELIHQVLDAICATFSHYINNATTTIMGHSELVEMAVRRGQFEDPDGRLVESMRMIENAVVNISAVLTEMKLLGKFEVVPYHDRAQILNIDEKVKRRVEQLTNR